MGGVIMKKLFIKKFPQKKSMGQSKEIKQNWKGLKISDIFFCVNFCCYDQNFISGRETGHWALPSTNSGISIIVTSFLRSCV